MTSCPARCYWVESPGNGSLRTEELPSPGPGDVHLQSEFSGISPGTERLVGLGLVPASCESTMACPGMRGSFALPVAYGYSLVGIVQSGAHAGKRAFVMQPHQDFAAVAEDRLVPLPDAVPAARATLLPNLETALNAVWDAELAGDERVVVIGAGAVGLLVAFVLSRLHRGGVTMVDADARRLTDAGELPWVAETAAPTRIKPGSFDVALHATGNAVGLQVALDAVGFEGAVVDLSWYGDKSVSLRLGDSFHHQRKRILASQVGTVARSHRAAGRDARTRAVLELLRDDQLDALLGAPVPFVDLPAFFTSLYEGHNHPVCPIVSYQTKT